MMESSLDSPEGRVVAFIDIGTNSIRMLLARLNRDQAYTFLRQEKEVVGLGQGEFGDQLLRPEAMQRAVNTCARLVEEARAAGAEQILAIATTATREARNQREFLQLLREQAQLEVRTISGKEEARLTFLGVSSGLQLEDQQALFIDIGGGSTELIVGDRQEYQYLDSLKLGAIRLTSLYFLTEEVGPIPDVRYALIQRYVRDAAVRGLQQIRQYRLDLAVGSSGTIENLADIAAYRSYGRPRDHADRLTFKQLEGVIAWLRSLPLDDRRRAPGIEPHRAETIVAGAAILHTLMQDLALSEVRISERGLLEGMLADYLIRSGHTTLVKGLTVREHSVLQLGRAVGFEEPHAQTVARLAQELFDSAREARLHRLGEAERELLVYAALLHDIGTFLSHTNHHAHSYYLIKNADLLGFDQSEIAIIATVAYFHRKIYPGKKHPQCARLDPRTRQVVRVMACFLQLAESLDRGHAGAIRQARLRALDERKARLELHADQDCQLEVWGVRDHKRGFKKTFGRKLAIEVVVGDS